MKTRLFLFAAILLVGCGDKVVTTPPSPPISGWRTAGLESPDRGEGDHFWYRLAVAGQRLVVLESMGDIWVSASYSNGWKKWNWSMPGTPHSIHARGDSLWVGTESPCRLYRCSITSQNCQDLRIGVPDSLVLVAIGEVRRQIVCRATSYQQDSTMILGSAGWQNWGEGHPNSSPYRFLTVGDTVWSATWEHGLYYRVYGEATWKRMPAPMMTWLTKPRLQDTAENPRGLAWHRGDLWVADWSGEMTRMPGGRVPYQAVRNCPPNLDACVRDLPVNLFAAASVEGRLVVAGYFGASGHVLDDSSRQWIPLEDSWCWNDLRDCGGTRTWDLVGLGDTIYSASNRFIMKFPVSDLPRMTTAIAKRYRWPLDTAWRDTFLNVLNPPRL